MQLFVCRCANNGCKCQTTSQLRPEGVGHKTNAYFCAWVKDAFIRMPHVTELTNKVSDVDHHLRSSTVSGDFERRGVVED